MCFPVTIPQNLQGLRPEDQVKDSTTGLDKTLSAISQADPTGIFSVNPLEAESLRKTFTANTFSEGPVTATAGRFVGAKSSRGTNEFYQIRNEVADNRKQASLAINKALAAGDVDGARQIAAMYNQGATRKFQPWVEKYGADSDDSLREQYQSMGITLDDRAIKQRLRNIRKKQEEDEEK